jgi:tetratricopeptide (TPR) repeat protein
MGVVYAAEDTRLNRPVALKFLPQDRLDEKEKIRFLNEARTAAAARHPNICPIYDVEEADGKIFIAMALVDGETLSARISRGALRQQEAIAIAHQVVSGLEAAHAHGIVHRDIKSSNIMVDTRGHVLILDFGLALQAETTRLTVTGVTLGTPAYMSPEQAQGLPMDHRADIWSLGVVLYEMVSGTLPFRKENAAAMLYAIVYDQPLPLTNASEKLRQVLKKALAKAPGDRFQSAGEFAGALKLVELPDATATRTVTSAMPTAVAHRWLSSRGARTAIAAGVVVMLAGGGYGVYRYVEARRGDSAASSGAKGLPEQKQVAVLPFEVIGTAESTRTVSDGMVEILASALSDAERFHGKISSVPSSEIRRRRITSAEEARQQFGVNLAITGSAQPAGADIEFTISLVDTGKMRQLASSHFVYDPANPLASRDQAVAVVGRLLQFEVTPAERTEIQAGDSRAPAAYSAYLEGRGLLSRFDVAGNVEKATAAFHRAIQEDPGYALAYAGLGSAYWRKTKATGDQEWSRLALTNAERAVKLGDSLTLPHTVLGEIDGGSGREEDAIRELRKAMELSPSNAEAMRQLATVYNNMGRFSEAEALYMRAIQMRPTDVQGHQLAGFFYYQRERYGEAEAEFKKALNLTPDNDMPYRNLGGIYVLEGRYQDAINQYQKALQIRPNAGGWASLGLAYYFQHRYADAVGAGETALDMDSSNYRHWGNLGVYYKWAPGQGKKAAPSLEKAVQMASKFLVTTPKDYSVRADLAEYYARLGKATEAWAEIGAIPNSVRGQVASRLALACELTGKRREAIEFVKTYLKDAASLSQIQNDPDLSGLWNDTVFQQTIRDRR